MAVDFSKASDAGFRRFGVDATYTPDGGSAVSVKVVLTRGEIADGGISRAGVVLSPSAQDDALMADLRASEVATPAKGATLTIDGLDYPVCATPELDSERKVWRLTLGKGS